MQSHNDFDAVPTLANEDLGGALLRFYWYYGHHFDLRGSIVMTEDHNTRIAPGPSSAGWHEHHRTRLSINDPARPDSDIGAKVLTLATQSYWILDP